MKNCKSAPASLFQVVPRFSSRPQGVACQRNELAARAMRRKKILSRYEHIFEQNFRKEEDKIIQGYLRPTLFFPYKQENSGFFRCLWLLSGGVTHRFLSVGFTFLSFPKI